MRSSEPDWGFAATNIRPDEARTRRPRPANEEVCDTRALLTVSVSRRFPQTAHTLVCGWNVPDAYEAEPAPATCTSAARLKPSRILLHSF